MNRPSQRAFKPSWQIGRSRVLALIVACIVPAIGPALGHAQPSLSPPPPTPQMPKLPGGVIPKSFLDDVLKRGHQNDWTFRVSIHLDSYQDPAIYTLRPSDGASPPFGSIPRSTPFKFDTAALVFPVLRTTSTSALAGDPRAKILFDQRDATGPTIWIEDLPGGTRYGRWDMKSKEGRAIDFEVEFPLTTWEISFNESAANRAVWPASGKWPREAASCLGADTIGAIAVVDPNSPAVREALAQWCSNKPPQSIPPVRLAKFLASRVLETMQPSGDGLVSSRNGLLQGFYLRVPERTLSDARASEHEIACLLCSVYRAAGLPARTVIGYDISESQGENRPLRATKPEGALRSWVEFCLTDENAILPTTGEPKAVWVPVDIGRQRDSSNKAPPLDKPWKFFGSNDETDDVIPIAYHYHPPIAGVVSHGSPCFWGWMTTPEMQRAEQTIRFLALTTPRTATTPSRPTK